MSKFHQGICQLLLLLLVTTPIMANSHLFSSSLNKDDTRTKISRRLQSLNLPLSVPTADAHTRRKIADYLGRGGHSTEKMLGRATQYFPVFELYLEKHGMPSSLKYLAVAESMLKPTAVSSVRAAGLWQFMPRTARHMGLRVDGIIDERLDLHRSTEAAVIMLKQLHEEFGDWHLALAAYNCGEGCVKRALRRAGRRSSYTKVKRYLPGETQRYVAAYVAAAYAVNYYNDHGLTPSRLEGVESIRIFDNLNLGRVARAVEMRQSTLRRMNPMFLRGYIPASKDGFRLWVPQNKKQEIQQYIWGRPNLVELPVSAELESAISTANVAMYDPMAQLLGCTTSPLVYAEPVWSFELLRQEMLLDHLANYQALAAL